MLQYDSDKNAWSGLLVDINNARKGIINIGEEANNFFKMVSSDNKDLSFLNTIDGDGFNDFIKQNELADESLVNFLKDTNYAQKDLASYQLYLKDTGKATTTFATLTKKTGNVLKSFGASLVSMGVSWLAGQALGLIIKGIDNLIHAEEKAAEKAEETAQKTGDAFDKIKSEMRELDSLIKEYNDLQLSNEWDNTPIETKRKLQEDINRLLGEEADRIDIINGKYRETTEELFKHRMNKLEEEEQTAFDDKEAKKNSLWKEMQKKGLEAERHFIINVDEMNQKESELFAKYSDMFGSIEKGYPGSGQYGLGEYDDTIIAYDWAGSYFSSVNDFLSKYDKAKELLLELREGMRYGEIEEDSVLYDRLNTFISTFETKVNEYRTSLDELSKADAGIKLSDYITNNVGGYIDNLEEYSKVIKWVNNNFSGEDKDNALGFLNTYFSEYAEKVDTAIGNLNEITVSLEHLKNASSGISHLSKAFKELNDAGYITTGTLSSIKEAVGSSVSNWDEYEKKLLNAKAGSAEFNQIMSDLTYAILENTFAEAGLENATEEQIEAVLRENGVVNASAQAAKIKAKAVMEQKIQEANLTENIGESIKELIKQGEAENLSRGEMLKLIAAQITFNRTDLDVTQKINALRELATQAGVATELINGALSVTTTGSSGTDKRKWAEENGIEITDDAEGRTGKTADGKEYKYWDYIYNGVRYDTIEEAQQAVLRDQINKRLGDPTEGFVFDLTSNASDNIPSYEDPTEAIINRINLRAKELEQDEEAIQNKIELAELENDYKKQISLTNDKLDVQRQKVDALKTANDELHQMAEDLRNGTPDWNEEEWFDSQGNATEAYNTLYNNSSKEEQEKIKEQFEKISKIKKAWVENDEERLSLTKEILEAEEDIVNLDYGHSQDWIDERNIYNDWAKYADSEVKAWKRVLERFRQEYPNELEKIKEIEENYFNARKEEFEKYTDFGASYFGARKTLLQSYYDVTNAIAEAQHEINKELETSKTMYEYLDEETRELLFNQEDYNILSEELYDIQYKADKLQRQYQHDLENSTLDTIEQITSNYEMQYETLMKSYEIAKADLDIAKKKAKLNNVLNERNVRMFINGQWQWVANTEDVANAKAELADAEYARKTAEAGARQTDAINALILQENQLAIVINKFKSGVIDLDTAIGLAEQAIGRIGNSYGTSKGVSGSGLSASNVSAIKSQMAKNSVAWHSASDSEKRRLEAENQALGKLIDSDYDPASGSWTHKYATGTGYTKSGKALMGENGDELFIDSNGHLIPINQPTIGNIASGGIVFNTDQMKNLRTLWDMSNFNLSGNSSYINTHPQQTNQTYDNRIIINGLTVDSGTPDGQAFINMVRRFVGNH